MPLHPLIQRIKLWEQALDISRSCEAFYESAPFTAATVRILFLYRFERVRVSKVGLGDVAVVVSLAKLLFHLTQAGFQDSGINTYKLVRTF